MALVQLEDVASYGTVGENDLVPNASRDDADLVGANEERAQLRLDVENPVLRDDEEVTVGGIEGRTRVHGFAGSIDEDA